MSGFATKINLTNSQVYIKELKLKHFKTLLKTLLSDDNLNDTYYNLTNILIEITNKKDIEQLSVIDYLLVILYVRCVSIGNTIQLEIDGDQNKIININLYKIIELLIDSIKFSFKQTVNDFSITYTVPTITDFLFLKDDIYNLLTFKKYIKTIDIPHYQTIEVSNLDNNVFLEFFKSLPASYSTIIIKHVATIIEELNNINLLGYLTEQNLSLFLNQENFIFILQLLFSKNLLPLYENIFALCKFTNLTPEYLENCTPGEYTIFVKLLEKVLKEQTIQQQSNNLPPINIGNPNFM